MRVLYITETLPWGRGESFFYPEIRELQRRGVDVRILPTFPGEEIFHREGHEMLPHLAACQRSPTKTMLNSSFKVIVFRRNIRHAVLGGGPLLERFKKAFKNIRLLARAEAALSDLVSWNPSHIHAQWANYTATLGWLIAEQLGVPWSFTAHRYDLLYDNLLAEKVKSARFVRITSHEALRIGKERGLLPTAANCNVAYMGVEVPKSFDPPPMDRERLTVAVPAALIKRKGHIVLLTALSAMPPELIKRLRVRFFGDGELRAQLLREIEARGFSTIVEANGAIPHRSLLECYAKREIDLVVLPTLNFGKGLGEGIPFSLIEAMGHGVPVVSTRTGGSPELLSEGAGVLVEPGDERQLATALTELIVNSERRAKIAEAGYRRVISSFSVETTTKRLLDLMNADSSETSQQQRLSGSGKSRIRQ